MRASTRVSPSPMIFMQSRDVKYATVLDNCAAHEGLTHLISAVSSSLIRGSPHTGHTFGASNTCSGAFTQPLSLGIISPLLNSLYSPPIPTFICVI